MRFRNPLIGLIAGLVVVALTVSDVGAAPPSKAPKTFAFVTASFTVTEGTGATIGVTRSAIHGPASVTVVTSDGTGLAGTNYTAVDTMVSFRSGQATATATVPTINVGALPGAGVTVGLTLTGPSRKYAIGDPGSATLTIYEEPVPNAPTGLTAELVTGFTIPHVELNWTASTGGTVDHYGVFSSTTSGGPYTQVDTTSGTSDELPAPSVTTYYVVTAVNAGGVSSGYSNEASAEPPVLGSGLYWANFSNGTIMAANPDGTDVTAIVTGQSSPWGVAVDASHVYWATETSVGTIMRANLDGSDVTTLVTGQSHPYGVAVDASYIYWADYSSGTIMRAGLDGSNVVTLVSGQSDPTAIAVDATHVYWSDTVNNEIWSANLDGSGATSLVDTGNYPFALAVDASHLYWAVTGSNEGSDGSIWESDLNGANASALVTNQAHPDGIAVGATYLYWANANSSSIVRANLDGSVATDVVSGQSLPSGIALSSS